MILLITVVILIAAVVMAFFILIQAPKGGGLTGNFGSLSTQVMGVKQSSNVMEKGTWVSMGIIAALSLMSVMFIDKAPRAQKQTAPAQQSAPAQQGGAPAAGAPAPAPEAPAQ